MTLTKARALALIDCYRSERWGRVWGYRSKVYTTGYHRGQDIRRLSADRSRSIVQTVVSLSAGRVVYVGRPNPKVGLVVVVETGRDEKPFEGHAHMAGVPVSVGDRVEAGTRLGRNANQLERPGIVGVTWDGPHDHFTINDSLSGLWNTSLNDYNPLPLIKAALREAEAFLIAPPPAPASGGSLFAPKEDDVFVKAKGRDEIYQIHLGQKWHIGPDAWAAIKSAYAAAGAKLPYSNGKLTGAQVDRIPTGS